MGAVPARNVARSLAAISAAAQLLSFLLLLSVSSRTHPRTADSFSSSSSWTMPPSPGARLTHPYATNRAAAAAFTTTVLGDKNATLSSRLSDPKAAASPRRQQLDRRNHTDDLLRFARGLQRARRQPQTKSNDSSSDTHGTAIDKPTGQPAYSLVSYLSTTTLDDDISASNDLAPVRDALSRAVIQGIRLGSSTNDYKLILKLVDATIHFASSHPVVAPRIFGEAVDGLSHTSASPNKIQKVWTRLTVADSESYFPSYLASPPGPYETNAMLKALVRRDKVGAALKLFRDLHSASGRASTYWRLAPRTDMHSVSVLLEGLTQSITTLDDSSAPFLPKATTTASLPALSLKRFRSWATSPCWQWNEAVSVLDHIIMSAPQPKDCDLVQNNHAVSALLKLNVRAGEAFPQHDAAQFTLEILDWMDATASAAAATNAVSSSNAVDAVTCTLLLKGLRSRWRAAVPLFQRMRSMTPPQPGTISFATPNEYCYSAVIAACAKNRRYEEAMQLLEELDHDPHCAANTPVYNSVLQALVTTRHSDNVGMLLASSLRSTNRMRHEARRRWKLAMHVFRRMNRNDHENHQPRADSITYNTLLLILSGTVHVLENYDWEILASPTSRAFSPAICDGEGWVEELPRVLIKRMVDSRLRRDDATYRHAFTSSTSLRGLACLVEAAMSDRQARVSHDALQSALPVAARLGRFEGLCLLLKVVPTPIESTTLVHLAAALAICQKTSLVPVATRAMLNDSSAIHRLKQELGCPVFEAGRQQGHDEDVSRALEAAVQTCLRARDLDSASLVIRQLKEGDRTRRLSPAVFQEVGRLYALQSLSPASSKGILSCSDTGGGATGQENARKAYTVLRSEQDPPLSLMTLVAKSLSRNGLFDEATDVLERIHALASKPPAKDDSRTAGTLQQVHKALLASCAESGNITAALGMCECIQKSAMSRPFQGHETQVPSEPSPDVSTRMNVAEWRLLLVAALKSGHWRVCLSTLQFLQPFVEALRPEIDADRSQATTQNRKYRELSSALNLVVKCLALRGQYGWIVRVLNDWVAWSGRRPPKQAVFLAIRALCVRGRGTEVGNLLAKCLAPSPMDTAREGPTYEVALAVFAITSLYNEGLYDAADDVFISSVRSKTLPLNLQEKLIPNTNKRLTTLDLHGMNLAVAHSAVRIALQQVARDSMTRQPEGSVASVNDLVIVTGRGRTSALRMRPVLRPEVQRMLVEEFYPPLGSSSIPGNMGALRVPGEDVQKWLNNQRVAKRSRVMTVAALLKKISSDAMRAAVTISSTGNTSAASPSD